MRTMKSWLIVLATAGLPALAFGQTTTVQQPQVVPPQVQAAPQQPMTAQQLQAQAQQVARQAQLAQQWAAYPYQPRFQQSWPPLSGRTGWPQTHPWPSQTAWPQTGWGSNTTVQPAPQLPLQAPPQQAPPR